MESYYCSECQETHSEGTKVYNYHHLFENKKGISVNKLKHMTNKEKLKSLLFLKVMTGENCAKWMPRPNVKNREKKRWATALRTHLRLTPKEYRKLLVENSNTVEQLMCAKEWSAIEYSKLPSKAMSSYMKAFSKQDNERFGQYLTSLEKGEVKINAGALYPYDIIMNMKHGNSRGADAQWLALPNFMGNGEERILPLVDVSSSMDQPVGDNANLNVLSLYLRKKHRCIPQCVCDFPRPFRLNNCERFVD